MQSCMHVFACGVKTHLGFVGEKWTDNTHAVQQKTLGILGGSCEIAAFCMIHSMCKAFQILSLNLCENMADSGDTTFILGNIEPMFAVGKRLRAPHMLSLLAAAVLCIRITVFLLHLFSCV